MTSEPLLTLDPTQWEYTQDACDIWEIHHLCNHFAEHGWEPVFAVETHEGVKLPERIGDDNGPRRGYKALRPYTVLFRRRLVAEDAEEYAAARAAEAAACTCPGCMTGKRCVEEQPEDDDEDSSCSFCPADCQICSDTPNCDCPTHGGE